MKERMQKTWAEGKGCPQKDKTESEGYVGGQTGMGRGEGNIVEVPFDKEQSHHKLWRENNADRSDSNPGRSLEIKTNWGRAVCKKIQKSGIMQ